MAGRSTTPPPMRTSSASSSSAPPARFADLASDLLWKPMGAGNADITVDAIGTPRTAGGVSMTARDLARLGELLRNHGVRNGRQIVREGWIRDMQENGDQEAARGPQCRPAERALSQPVVSVRRGRPRLLCYRHPRPMALCRSQHRDGHRQALLPAGTARRRGEPGQLHLLPGALRPRPSDARKVPCRPKRASSSRNAQL